MPDLLHGPSCLSTPPPDLPVPTCDTQPLPGFHTAWHDLTPEAKIILIALGLVLIVCIPSFIRALLGGRDDQ